MLDVKTPFSKLHRISRSVDASAFVAAPGLWAYLSSGTLTNVVTTATQPKVLRMVLGNASSNAYESHDIEVGRCATLEHVFRATVDSDGYQATIGGTGTQAITAISYVEGDELTIAHLTTSATANTAYTYAKAADLGKLRPLTTATFDNGKIVVARVESYDATAGRLTFNTVTPYPAIRA